MLSRNSLNFGDKVIALTAPVLGGALMAGIRITADLASGKAPDLFQPAYVLENSVYAAAGAILSSALFAARYVIMAAMAAKENYLQIPWSPASSSSPTKRAKLDVMESIGRLFEHVDSTLERGLPQELAVRLVHSQIEEQRDSLDSDGRIQFVSPNPRNAALRKSRSLVTQAMRTDGYDLIVSAAQHGDRIESTDFQNSVYWWLNRKVAFSFFEYNLDILRKGATIARIFGRNHPDWAEDEAGAKQALIDLQSKIKGLDVFTIDYSDFDEARGLEVEQFDQMCLLRGSEPQPSIEWEINKQGDTEKVFFVLGKARLEKLSRNFTALVNSHEMGSTLKKIEAAKIYDPANEEHCARIREELRKIANRC
jgi:hypothetical protein